MPVFDIHCKEDAGQYNATNSKYWDNDEQSETDSWGKDSAECSVNGRTVSTCQDNESEKEEERGWVMGEREVVVTRIRLAWLVKFILLKLIFMRKQEVKASLSSQVITPPVNWMSNFQVQYIFGWMIFSDVYWIPSWRKRRRRNNTNKSTMSHYLE